MRGGGAQHDGGSTMEQRGCSGGGGSVTARRWRQLGGGAMAAASKAVAADANRGSGAQRNGRRNTEAAADSPTLSANVPTHAPSDAQKRRRTRWNVETY
jgi:hypothetical protein